ncbi:MAG TPA: TolC family protein [Fluviicola sp.]|nr:TolC family protein [Fluviicola sp.]
MKHLHLVGLFVLIAYQQVSAQTTMDLRQCIQYGLTHNAQVQQSQLAVARTNEQRNEVRAGYLPQIEGSASLTDNLQLQTSIIPGEIFGQPGEKIAVQFGTKYNVMAGVDAHQVLYNQSLIYGLKIAEKSSAISAISAKKTEEQLMYDIATAFYAAQVSFTQQSIVADNIAQVDTLIRLTTIQFDNGFAKQIDLDRLVVNRTNLQTDFDNSNQAYQQQLMLLKYYMGMPLETELNLPLIDSEANVVKLTDPEALNQTDLSLLQAQQDLYSIQLKQIKAGYLPTLSLAFHSGLQIQQNDLRIFGKDADWFPNSYVSLSLNVPIFDGLAKNSRVKQMTFQLKESELSEQYLLQGLKMQRTNALSKLQINQAALEKQQRNIELSRKIYEVTQAQYTGGVVTLSELVNAETALKESQTNYLQALVQVKLAELELIKTTGTYTTLN